MRYENYRQDIEKKVKFSKPSSKSEHAYGRKSLKEYLLWLFKGQGSCDFPLALLTVLLVLIGSAIVFSATSYVSIVEKGNTYDFFIKSLVFALSGLLIMLFTSFIPFNIWRKKAVVFIILMISIALLLVVLSSLSIATPLNGAQRWIQIGGFTFMPGELAKIAGYIVSAAWITSFYRKIFTTKTVNEILTNRKSHSRRLKAMPQLVFGLIPLGALLVLDFLLIYKQPNLSTALIVCGIIVGVLFFSGISFRWVGSLGCIAILGVIGLILANPNSEHYRRLMSFKKPFERTLTDNYQLSQSLKALGNGGLLGVGPGNSVAKSLYLSEAGNDFVFAIIGEEFGFIGVTVLFILFVLFIWRLFSITLRAKNRHAMLLASGITTMFTLQIVMNILVAIAWMPTTGVSLPFISYGGNAIWFQCFSIGILMNISRSSVSKRKDAQVMIGENG